MDALLIGYERPENLGLRSIAAYLLGRGYEVAIVPFTPGPYDEILAAVQRLQPRLVGFSLIFQYTLDEFGRLMTALREGGVDAHFTAGGHFPSLRPEDTLALFPQLDSVVRFEGEHTMADLLQRLDRPKTWEQIQGLAFRRGQGCVLTPPRPLIAELDTLPFVYRDGPQQPHSGIETASMLASRGCLHDCSFCSIRQFYGQAPGHLRRVRSPRSVVEEMSLLASDRGIRFFSFQDDDFATRTPRQRAWLLEFLAELRRTGLSDAIGWKISCRVDDLDPEVLKQMAAHGLMVVYLGVESGSPAGLGALNKHVTVDQNERAVQLVKDSGVALGMGFMLFDPSSTLSTIRESIAFLRRVGEDGYLPINFCKMLPYAGTPIEADLRRSGRLGGTMTDPDYKFFDRRVDWYSFLAQRIFSKRNFSVDGTVLRLQQADIDLRLRRRFGPPGTQDGLDATIRRLTRWSNEHALTTLDELLALVQSYEMCGLLSDEELLPALAEREWRGEMQVELELERALS